MADIIVDFSKIERPMKPMHGTNCGCLSWNLTCDASPLFKEAGIPYTRLHDCEYPFGSGEYVDIDCIFRNFDADENNPESYNFGLTDLYLKAIYDAGTKIMYRLGSSIEHAPVKRHINPPKDYTKWAKICEHIIMHYNEGWANGFNFGIDYWEIWTEPNHCNSERPLMWTSDIKEFSKFYTVVSKYLKGKFPKLKIGGPAFSNPASPMVDEFLGYIADEKAPLDFFSWHGYVDTVEKAVERCKIADEKLQKYGYSDSESIYDEWNYVKDWNNMPQSLEVIHGQKGVAFGAAMMARLQSENITMLNNYATDARLYMWNAFCERDLMGKYRNGGARPMKAKKAFYSFKAFNEVYKDKNQVKMQILSDNLYGVAAMQDGKGTALVSYFADIDEKIEDKEVQFEFIGAKGKKATLYLIDETRSLSKIATFDATSFSFVMTPYSVIMIKIN